MGWRKTIDGPKLRGVALAFALLALALKIAVPPGFMLNDRSGPLLVLCPAQGAMPSADMGAMAGMPMAHAADASLHGGDGPPVHSHATSDCVFAGHALNAPLQLDNALQPLRLATYEAERPPRLWRYITPGRGLTAPPLPARGPPLI